MGPFNDDRGGDAVNAARVSLGVPVYNGEKYLREALDSVVAQDVDGLEIVISDNASNDSTEAICREYAADDPRIRYVRQPRNIGGVPNLNFVLNAARSPWFKWAFYDDVLRPDYLPKCMAAIDASGRGVVGAHTRVLVIDDDGTVVEERDDEEVGADAPTAHQRLSNVYRKLANQLQFGVMSTDAMRRAGGHGRYYAADMTLLTSVMLEGAMVQVSEPLMLFRRHPAQFGNDRFSEMKFYANPGQTGKYLPWFWLNAQMLQTVLRSQLPAAERARCVQALLAEWTLRQWRGLAGDIKFLPKTIKVSRALSAAAKRQ